MQMDVNMDTVLELAHCPIKPQRPLFKTPGPSVPVCLPDMAAARAIMRSSSGKGWLTTYTHTAGTEDSTTCACVLSKEGM